MEEGSLRGSETFLSHFPTGDNRHHRPASVNGVPAPLSSFLWSSDVLRSRKSSFPEPKLEKPPLPPSTDRFALCLWKAPVAHCSRAHARSRSSVALLACAVGGWGVTATVAPRGLGGYASLISWSPNSRALLRCVPRASPKRPCDGVISLESFSLRYCFSGPTEMFDQQRVIYS